MKRSIRLKTFFFTTVLIITIMCLSFGIIYFFLPKYYMYTKENELKENTQTLVSQLKKTSNSSENLESIQDFALKSGAVVISYNDSDTIIPKLSSPFILSGISDLNFNSENITYSATSIRDDDEKLTIIKKINNGEIREISITAILQPVDEAKSTILAMLPFLFVINIILSFLASYFYSKRLVTPIIKISNAAKKMRRKLPDVSAKIYSNDELGELSQNLDTLYGELLQNISDLESEMNTVQALQKSKIDFMRAASHELKTPIAALSGILEGMLDNVGMYTDRERYIKECWVLTEKMANLVSDILIATKKSEEVVLVYERINIRDTLEDALREFLVFFREKNLLLCFDEFDYMYETDRNLLYITFTNLLSNAVKYSPNEGEITIGFDEGILTIENTCEEISLEEISRLSEAFYTLNISRNKLQSGSGLGLYIVDNNLKKLEIEYTIERTNTGIRFSLFFCGS